MMIISMSIRLTKSQFKLTEPNQNTINGNLKSSHYDVKDDLHDTINDDMDDMKEYKEYEDYVEPVKVKQSDDLSAEVEDENNVDATTKLIMVSNLFFFIDF